MHTIMYSYYFLSALGPEMQKYLWWKRYITKMQMVRMCREVSVTAISHWFKTQIKKIHFNQNRLLKIEKLVIRFLGKSISKKSKSEKSMSEEPQIDKIDFWKIKMFKIDRKLILKNRNSENRSKIPLKNCLKIV